MIAAQSTWANGYSGDRERISAPASNCDRVEVEGFVSRGHLLCKQSPTAGGAKGRLLPATPEIGFICFWMVHGLKPASLSQTSKPTGGMLSKLSRHAQTTATLISVPLAAYFYLQAREYPELAYFVSPVKAIVVRKGQASSLITSRNGKTIETDVTTAQIAIWNRGKRPIRSTNVLAPIVVQIEGDSAILEASVRKRSRDVTRLALHTDQYPTERVASSGTS